MQRKITQIIIWKTWRSLFFIFGPSYPPSKLTLSSIVVGGSASWSRGSDPGHLTIVPGNLDGVPLLVLCTFRLCRILVVTRRPAIWIATKYFFFWAINILIPSVDSNLGPKACHISVDWRSLVMCWKSYDLNTEPWNLDSPRVGKLNLNWNKVYKNKWSVIHSCFEWQCFTMNHDFNH